MATQEEVLNHIRIVAQGLESLQSEHQQILSGLKHSSSLGNDLITEKVALMQKSADSIDLAIGEARVSYIITHYFKKLLRTFYFDGVFKAFIITNEK